MMAHEEWRDEWIKPVLMRLKEGPASKQELAETVGTSPARLDWMVETLVDYEVLKPETDNGRLMYRLQPEKLKEGSLAFSALQKLMQRMSI